MAEEIDKDEGTRSRKAYEKPTIEKVPLKPEEAVLGFCKSSGIGGPVGLDCQLAGCSSLGS
ncbi:MAG: hypothetical protein IPJ88_08355 [Myxococcales bacterium]|nr:MAG: hypothetical protein IPJ88_08355 [Myxococcales bacterium]